MDAPVAYSKQRKRLFQVVLIGLFILFVGYRLLSAWTSFWIDLLFIVVGCGVLLTMPKASSSSVDSKVEGR